MADDSEVVIKVSGDVKNFTDAMNSVKDKTEEIGSHLKGLAAISGVAFAGQSFEIGELIKKYGESEKALNQLTQSMANQGIYSDKLLESYKKSAEELEKKSGFDADQILSADALLQTYSGSIPITEKLQKAIVDLAAAKHMDLQSTVQLIGQGLNGHARGLQQLGVHIFDTSTKEEKLTQITEQLSKAFSGQAEASVQGVGKLTLLERSFENLQKRLGEQLAPIVEKIAETLTEWFNYIASHPEITQMIGEVLALTTAMSGLVGIISVLRIAFTGLVGSTGIGLILIAITELYLHWDTAWKTMRNVTVSVVDNMSKVLEGFGFLLGGLFDALTGKGLSTFKEGLKKIGEALSNGYKEFQKEQEKDEKKITENTKTEANKRAVINKQAEVDASQTILQERNKRYLALLKADEGYQKLSAADKKLFDREFQDANVKATESERTTAIKWQQERLKKKIDNDNAFLKEQLRFGTAYAKTQAMFRTEDMNNLRDANNELMGLQNSHNAAIKGVGKAAALTDIAINTPPGALKAYAALSGIPFIGPALGAAAAAAVIAYGVERAGDVLAAKEGGLALGGIPGQDSIPALLTHGELISPAQNFEEVIGSVRAQREAEKVGATPFGAGGGGSSVVELRLKDDLVNYVEAKIIERQRLNIGLTGGKGLG